MRNLFNFLIFALIIVLEIKFVYGDKARKCWIRYEEPVEKCLAHIPSYYYDLDLDECVFFIYGGCGGNANNFKSKDECEHECDVQPKDEIGEYVETNPCLMPYEKPRITCLAYMPRYYYDKDLDECVFFIYGGCGGNANNFMSRKQCEQECEVQPKYDIGEYVETNPCLMPYEKPRITCLAHMPRYYYDMAKDKCVSFIYGGCGGNANNFSTKKECQETCVRRGHKCKKSCVKSPRIRKSLQRMHLTQEQINALRLLVSRI